jgi:c-di-AMP phosphodiesterase-like protein
LTKGGARIDQVVEYMSLPKSLMKGMGEAFENAKVYNKSFVISILPNSEYAPDTISIFADKLLSFKDVKASFVIGKLKTGK